MALWSSMIVTMFLQNTWIMDLVIAELSVENCDWDDLIVAELSTGWLGHTQTTKISFMKSSCKELMIS